MPPNIARVSKLLLILLIPILIIGGTVRLLVTDQYLGFEYRKDGFPADAYGLTTRQRLQLASTNVHYVRAHIPGDALSNETVAGAPLYTAREVSHMADVRAMFQEIFGAWQIAFLLFLVLTWACWRAKEQRTLAWGLRAGGILTVGMVLSIALMALFAWQMWFKLFHRFFFEDGTWLFSYSDMLIRLFPVEFWFDATVIISLLSLVGGLLVAFTGWAWSMGFGQKPGQERAWAESSSSLKDI
jgi:integral membrane protein (TIGR01906 family)